jgi:hypothetical protein
MKLILYVAGWLPRSGVYIVRLGARDVRIVIVDVKGPCRVKQEH